MDRYAKLVSDLKALETEFAPLIAEAKQKQARWDAALAEMKAVGFVSGDISNPDFVRYIRRNHDQKGLYDRVHAAVREFIRAGYPE